jgi:DNA gyrase subunit A
MMITANGIIIRMGLDQVRQIGRNTQGVRMINIKEGDKLVAAEKINVDEVNEESQTSESKKKSDEDQEDSENK